MRTVLITGATGNLGKACVEEFLKEGYKVIITTTPEKKSAFSDSKIVSYEADLSDESKTQQVISTIIKQHQQIDAALLLVGGFAMGNIHNTGAAELDKMFSLNFNTTYFTVRPVFEQMLKQTSGGRIIMIGSKPALRPTEGKDKLAYSLSKSLIFKLAELLNAQGSANNVTTSVIVPSTIDTETNRKEMPDADFSKWVKPTDLAKAMLFLCSTEATPLRDAVLKMYGPGSH